MCHYIEASHIMPGWACCRCRTYNGLHREFCKRCRQKQHQLMVPEEVHRCPGCGFGYRTVDLNARKGGRNAPTIAEAGCPACGTQLVQQPPERWRCYGCGMEFESETHSHPVHSALCEGDCRYCPEQCGPVTKIESVNLVH